MKFTYNEDVLVIIYSIITEFLNKWNGMVSSCFFLEAYDPLVITLRYDNKYIEIFTVMCLLSKIEKKLIKHSSFVVNIEKKILI